MIYLASPYSHPDDITQACRYELVCEMAAQILALGKLVISPIAHSHNIAKYLRGSDWKTWERLDKAIIDLCDEVWVLTLPDWETSIGVCAEIEYAEKTNKPVRFVSIEDIENMEPDSDNAILNYFNLLSLGDVKKGAKRV